MNYDFEPGQIASIDEDFNISIDSDSILPDDKTTIVIVPFDPVKKSDADFEMIALLNGRNVLTEDQKELCRKYKRYIIYSAVIREKEGKLKWSNTAASEGIFEPAEKYCNEELVLDWLFVIQNYLKRSQNKRSNHSLRSFHYNLRL